MGELPTIDGYHVTHVIGEGGMGRVYGGQRVGDGLPVAVKVMLGARATGATFLRRFDREIKVCAAFAHPYVIKILDGGRLERTGEPYFVMEFLAGESLAEKCKRGPISEGLALNVLRSMAEALSYVHAKGVLHRDIKPENIFLEKTGRVVLLDFGLATSSEETKLTDTEEVVGTFCTIAPERLKSGEGDCRSDIYGLGMTVYFALAEKYPFDLNELLAILRGESSQEASLLPGFVGKVVARCIRMKSSERYGSADTLLAVLEGEQTGRMGAVEPPRSRELSKTGASVVLRRESRRNRMLGLLIFTLLVIAFLFWLQPKPEQGGRRLSRATSHNELLEARKELLPAGAELTAEKCRLVGRLAGKTGALKRLRARAKNDEIAGLYYLACVAEEQKNHERAYDILRKTLSRGGPNCLSIYNKLLMNELVFAAHSAKKLSDLHLWLLRKYELAERGKEKHLYGYGYALAAHHENRILQPTKLRPEAERAYKVAFSLIRDYKNCPIQRQLYSVWLELVTAGSRKEVRDECTRFVLRNTNEPRSFGMPTAMALRSAAICVRHESYGNRRANTSHGGDIKLADKAIHYCQSDRERSLINLLRGLIKSDNHKLKEALLNFNEIDQKLLTRFDSYQYYLGLGKLYQRMSKYEEAIASMQKALEFTDRPETKENVRNRIVTVRVEQKMMR